jgi:hypothetical protein
VRVYTYVSDVIHTHILSRAQNDIPHVRVISMYLRACKFAQICICTTHIYVLPHTYFIFVHSYTHLCIYLCQYCDCIIYIYIHTYICIHMYSCVYVCMYVYVASVHTFKLTLHCTLNGRIGPPFVRPANSKRIMPRINQYFTDICTCVSPSCRRVLNRIFLCQFRLSRSAHTR